MRGQARPAAARGMRASVDVILHATEDESLYRAALASVLGIGDGIRVRAASGHYGNRIRVMSARVRGAGAALLVDAVAGAMRPGDAERVAGGIGAHVSDGGLHLRFDKQEFVQGRLALGGPEPVRVRIAAPAHGEGRGAAGAYLEMLNLKMGRPAPQCGDEDAVQRQPPQSELIPVKTPRRTDPHNTARQPKGPPPSAAG